MNIYSSKFYNNKGTYGGAIFNVGNYTIYNEEDNKTDEVDGGELSINNSIFESNKGTYGGGIAAMKYNFTHKNAKYIKNYFMNINSSTFTNNVGTNAANAIYNVGKLTLTNSKFSTNGKNNVDVIYNTGNFSTMMNNSIVGGSIGIKNTGKNIIMVSNIINTKN